MAFNIVAQLQLQGPANLRPVINNIQNALRNIQATVNVNINPNTTNGLSNLNKQLNQVQTSLGGLDNASSSANKALNSTASGFNNASKASAAFSANTTKNVQDMKNVISSLSEGASAAENFGKAAGLAARRYSAFLVAGGAILEFVQSTKSAVKEAIEFEREIVKLGQVGAGTTAQIKSIEAEVTRLSTSLGVNSKELIQASVTLAQAGYNADQTKKALEALAQAALSPSFGDMSETVEGAIAVMQQFRIQTDGLSGALGSINAVAAGFAVESKDLIDAIKRAGGAFRSTGGDLNEFLGLFTSIRATTRESAESISTGLRTIFARLQRQDTVDALESLGINLRHTREEAVALGNVQLERQFVGPYEAVIRLNQALRDVPGTDPRYSQIIEQLGGYRQISRVIPLIQELTTAQKAYATAQFGAFSLQTSANQAQEATIVKLERLRQQFLALFRTVEESEGFRTFLDITVKLAGAVTQLVDALTPLIPLLGTLAALKIGQSLTGFAAGISIGLQGGVQQSKGVVRRATGGIVPGVGNTDSVHTMLTPGEYVIRKSAVNAIGVDNLEAINAGKYNAGGVVQRFARGGIVNRQQLNEIREAVVSKSPDANRLIADYTGITGGAELREFKKRFGGQEREFNTLSRGLSKQKIDGKRVPVLVTPFNNDKMGMLTIGNVADSGVKLVEGLTAKKEANFVAQKALDMAGIENIRSGLTVHILSRGVSKQFINDYENKINPALTSIFPAESGIKVNLQGSAKRTIAGYLFEEFIGAASKIPVAGGEAGFEYPGNFNADPKVNQVARYVYPSISPGELLDVKYVTNIRKTSQDIVKKYLNHTTANGSLFTALGLNKDDVRNSIFNKNVVRQRKAAGGTIDGSDGKVPVVLTPGEYVMSKEAVSAHGTSFMDKLNTQRFALGGKVRGRQFNVGYKVPVGLVAREGEDDEAEILTNLAGISSKDGPPLPIRNFINDLKSNQVPTDDLGKYIKIRAKVQRSVLNPNKKQDFEHDVTDVITSGVNKLIADLPALRGNYKPTLSPQAIANFVGPTFELYISRLTGSALSEGNAPFDFPGLTNKNLSAFNKIFSPNVTAKYIDAKSRSSENSTKSIIKKGLNQGLFTDTPFDVPRAPNRLNKPVQGLGGLKQRFAVGGRVLGINLDEKENELRTRSGYNRELISRIKKFPAEAKLATNDPLADQTLRSIVEKARRTPPTPFPGKDALTRMVRSGEISQGEANRILTRFDTLSRLIPDGAKNVSRIRILDKSLGKGINGYFNDSDRHIGIKKGALLDSTLPHELVHAEQHATGKYDIYENVAHYPSSAEQSTDKGREEYFLHFSELEARLRQENLLRAAKVIDRLKAAGKFAGGGSVGGSGNKDNVPAVLTPGEYVMNKGSVQKYGVNFFNQLNAKRFASGGEVQGEGFSRTFGDLKRFANSNQLEVADKAIRDFINSVIETSKQFKNFSSKTLVHYDVNSPNDIKLRGLENSETDKPLQFIRPLVGNSQYYPQVDLSPNPTPPQPSITERRAARLGFGPKNEPVPTLSPTTPANDVNTIQQLIEARAEKLSAPKKVNGQISDRTKEESLVDAQKEIYNQILRAKKEELSKTKEYTTLIGKAIGSIQNIINSSERKRIAEETAAKAIQFSSTATATLVNGQIKLNQATLQASQAIQQEGTAANVTTQANRKLASTKTKTETAIAAEGVAAENTASTNDISGTGSKRSRFGGAFFAAAGVASLAGGYLQQPIQNALGSTQQAAITGRETSAALGAGISGAIGTAGIGAAIGTAILPGFGTAIGAATGAVIGFVSSMDDAKKEIQEIKISNAVEDVAKNLQRLADGVDIGANSIRTVALNLSDIKSDTLGNSVRDATTFGNFNAKAFSELESKKTRDRFGGIAPLAAQVLSKSAQDIGIKNASTFGSGDISSLVTDFKNAGNGLNKELLNILSKVEKIPVDKVVEKFNKELLSSQRNEFLKNQAKTSENNIDKLYLSFGRLSSVVDAAAAKLARFEQTTNVVSSLFESRLSGSVSGELSGKIGSGNQEEFRNIVARVAGTFGQEGEQLKNTINSLDAVKRILPAILSGSTAQGNLLNGAEPGTNIKNALALQLTGQDVTKITGPLRQIIESVGVKVNEIVSDPEKLAKARENIPGFTKDALSGYDAPAQEFENIARKLEDNGNKFIKGLIEYQAKVAKTGEELDKIFSLKTTQARNNAEQQAIRTGRPSDALDLIPRAVLESFFQGRQERLTNAKGSLATNADFIATQLAAVQAKAQAILPAVNNEVGQGPNTVKFIELQNESARLTEALKNLTNVADRNAAIQEKLNKIEQERQARLGFAEKYVTANAKERGQIDYGINLVKASAQPGFNLRQFSDQQRKILFDTLNSLRGNTIKTANGPIKAEDFKNNLLEGTPIGKLPKAARDEKAELEKARKTNIDEGVKAQQLLASNLTALQVDYFTKLRAENKAFLTELFSGLKEERVNIATNNFSEAQNRVDEAKKKLDAAKALENVGISNPDTIKLLRVGGSARADLESLGKNLQTDKNLQQNRTEIENRLKNSNGLIESVFSADPELTRRRGADQLFNTQGVISDLQSAGGRAVGAGRIGIFTREIINKVRELTKGTELENKSGNIAANFLEKIKEGKYVDNEGVEKVVPKNSSLSTVAYDNDSLNKLLKKSIQDETFKAQREVTGNIFQNRAKLLQAGVKDNEFENISSTIRNKGLESFTSSLDALGTHNIPQLQANFDLLNKELERTRGLLNAAKGGGAIPSVGSGSTPVSTAAALNTTASTASSPASPSGARTFTIPATEHTPAFTIPLEAPVAPRPILPTTVNPLAPTAENIADRFGRVPVNPYTPTFGAAGTGTDLSPSRLARPPVNPLLAVPSTTGPVSALPATPSSGSSLSSGLGAAASATAKLSDTLGKIPDSISLEGKHEVTVVVNGLEVLAQLQPEIQKLVGAASAQAINKLIADKMPDAGRMVA